MSLKLNAIFGIHVGYKEVIVYYDSKDQLDMLNFKDGDIVQIKRGDKKVLVRAYIEPQRLKRYKENNINAEVGYFTWINCFGKKTPSPKPVRIEISKARLNPIDEITLKVIPSHKISSGFPTEAQIKDIYIGFPISKGEIIFADGPSYYRTHFTHSISEENMEKEIKERFEDDELFKNFFVSRDISSNFERIKYEVDGRLLGVVNTKPHKSGIITGTTKIYLKDKVIRWTDIVSILDSRLNTLKVTKKPTLKGMYPLENFYQLLKLKNNWIKRYEDSNEVLYFSGDMVFKVNKKKTSKSNASVKRHERINKTKVKGRNK